jgi:hypothetical protein
MNNLIKKILVEIKQNDLDINTIQYGSGNNNDLSKYSKKIKKLKLKRKTTNELMILGILNYQLSLFKNNNNFKQINTLQHSINKEIKPFGIQLNLPDNHSTRLSGKFNNQDGSDKPDKPDSSDNPDDNNSKQKLLKTQLLEQNIQIEQLTKQLAEQAKQVTQVKLEELIAKQAKLKEQITKQQIEYQTTITQQNILITRQTTQYAEYQLEQQTKEQQLIQQNKEQSLEKLDIENIINQISIDRTHIQDIHQQEIKELIKIHEQTEQNARQYIQHLTTFIDLNSDTDNLIKIQQATKIKNLQIEIQKLLKRRTEEQLELHFANKLYKDRMGKKIDSIVNKKKFLILNKIQSFFTHHAVILSTEEIDTINTATIENLSSLYEIILKYFDSLIAKKKYKIPEELSNIINLIEILEKKNR